MYMNKSTATNFLKSALTEENPFIETLDVIEWLKKKNNEVTVNVEKVSFNELDNWSLNKVQGKLMHNSDSFFSIDGIKVQTNVGKVKEWEQPIINQPEIGYLGIITKEFNGVLYFLLQAKIEPGNVNNVQLSPTLQATKSNYTQVHKGKKPMYLDCFQNAKKDEVIIDQLQSEQGARFFKKRNRNIIIKIDGDIKVEDNFIWLTLGQIKKLILKDNLINMDTRTVISGITFQNLNLHIDLPTESNILLFEEKFETGMLLSILDTKLSLHTFDEIINWLTFLKCKYELEVTSTSLFNTKDWLIKENIIHHIENKFFKVIATKVEITNREVSSWYQPLIEPVQEGLITFIVKKINGVYHFLVQAKVECGNFDIVEMAPTVQCITGSYNNDSDVPFLNYVLNVSKNQIKFDTLQSEEGGRFYKEQNRSMIIEAEESFGTEVPENYKWLTLNQLGTFLKFNNFLNIQSRSLISAINFI